ncbi:preprotein translocase subunit YajC [Tessaracoccus sp. HDW20]|uniref:preprotein translocase subunit YajC n=1 Tax=Tessaracoccus coleopterorum TaxID=2714950 RepID=UPI0018D31E00|nr:preprotein translocase subunit YajC [Tessaracoccus coleopterorum]NHB86028.1 preprotein translocase subunit YajC [Tessaracoccus coleopterorum]
MILLLVAMFAIMYFLMIRPQQKKMKEDMQMRSQLAEGDRVLLTSGIFGTIAHVGERQMIIELAPGVEITVLKGNVARQVLPADEEFEFTDEVGADEAGDAADAVDAVDAVDAGSDDLTRENFDNMFDPAATSGPPMWWPTRPQSRPSSRPPRAPPPVTSRGSAPRTPRRRR